MYAIRGCASVLFKAAQLAALQVSAANIVSLNNTCYTSQPDSITGIAPALASVCFCDTDSCNAASWDAIMPTVAAQSGTSALTTISLSSSSVVMRIVIVIACFIASGN
uniref:Uncharacterized protein n=1 Tax=Plectus sambesii TaxID=2011161 RepID=A0A914XMF9_9BILA